MTIVNDRGDLRHTRSDSRRFSFFCATSTGRPPRNHDVHSYGAEEYRSIAILFDVSRTLLVNNLKIMPRLLPRSYISSVALSARCNEEFRWRCRHGNENGSYLRILFIMHEWIALIYHVFHFPSELRYLALIRCSWRAEIWCARWRCWCTLLDKLLVRCKFAFSRVAG